MNTFKSVFGDSEAYKLYSEYSIYVGNQKIGIKIVVDFEGTYGYKLSHHYKGSQQFTEYVSSINYSFDDERQALVGAKSEIFSFYNPNDEDAKWILDDSYYIC